MPYKNAKKREKPIHQGALIKMKTAVRMVREDPTMDLKKALLKVGYSERTIDRGAITATKTWQHVMQEEFPDDLLADRHRELLNKRQYEKVTVFEKGPDGKTRSKYVLEDVGPDTTAVTKALDMAYKMKGYYKEDKTPEAPKKIYNLFFNPEVRKATQDYEQKLKDAIRYEALKGTGIEDVTPEGREGENVESGEEYEQGGVEDISELPSGDLQGEGGTEDGE